MHSQYLTLSLFRRKSPSNACLPGTNRYTFPPPFTKRTVPLRPYLQPVSKKVVSNSQCVHVLACCVSLTNLPWILKGAIFFSSPNKRRIGVFLSQTRAQCFRRTCGIFLWDPTSLGGDKILCLAEGGGRTQVQQRRSTFSSNSNEGT